MRQIDHRPVPQGISNVSRHYTAEYHLLPGTHSLSVRNYVKQGAGRGGQKGFAAVRPVHMAGMLNGQLELKAGRVYEVTSAWRPVGPGPRTVLDPGTGPRSDWVLAVKSVQTIESFALRLALGGGGPSHWRSMVRNHAMTLSTLDIARLDVPRARSASRKRAAKTADTLKAAEAAPGVAEIQAGNYEAAIRELTQRIAHSPADVDALVNRGVAYERTGQYERAVGDFDRVLKIGPHGPAYLNRAVALHRMRRRAEAEADLRRALELCLTPGFKKAVVRTLKIVTRRRKR